jgi:hypothetical protein
MNLPIILTFVGPLIELGRTIRDLVRACKAGDEQARKAAIDALAVESERVVRKAAN